MQCINNKTLFYDERIRLFLLISLKKKNIFFQSDAKLFQAIAIFKRCQSETTKKGQSKKQIPITEFVELDDFRLLQRLKETPLNILMQESGVPISRFLMIYR